MGVRCGKFMTRLVFDLDKLWVVDRSEMMKNQGYKWDLDVVKLLAYVK